MATRTTTDEQDKIVQFSTTEQPALKWSTEALWDLTVESTHEFNQVLSKLSGPHKRIPFIYESYGAMIRGIEVPVLRGQEWTPWRQPLVDFILAYRRIYHQSYHNGGNAPNSLLVNFHELDPVVFPDEYVLEGSHARRHRFAVQRYLFGIACNTDVEELGPTVQAHTDWDFTGLPPFVETVGQGIWIDAGHAAGHDHMRTGHGYTVGMDTFDTEFFIPRGDVPGPLQGDRFNANQTPGNDTWDRLMAAVPWLRTRIEGYNDDPAARSISTLHPILQIHRKFQIRAKDINDAAAVAWRENQATPAAGAPPLAGQTGDRFGGKYIFSHGITLNPSPSYRSARVCSRDQYDHTCIETARWLSSLLNYEKAGKTAIAWYSSEIETVDMTGPRNPTLEICKVIISHDRFRPRMALRQGIEAKFYEIKYEPIFYVSLYLEALERLSNLSLRLPLSERTTVEECLKKALRDLVDFARMPLGSSDKLQDAYIELFTAQQQRDEPKYRDDVEQYLSTWAKLTQRVVSLEGIHKATCARKDVMPAKWTLVVPGVPTPSASSHRAHIAEVGDSFEVDLHDLHVADSCSVFNSLSVEEFVAPIAEDYVLLLDACDTAAQHMLASDAVLGDDDAADYMFLAECHDLLMNVAHPGDDGVPRFKMRPKNADDELKKVRERITARAGNRADFRKKLGRNPSSASTPNKGRFQPKKPRDAFNSSSFWAAREGDAVVRQHPMPRHLSAQQNKYAPFRTRSNPFRDPPNADRRYPQRPYLGPTPPTSLRSDGGARPNSTTPPALLKKVQDSISPLQSVQGLEGAANTQVQAVIKQLQTCYVAEDEGVPESKADTNTSSEIEKISSAVGHAIHTAVNTEADPDGAQQLHAELVKALMHSAYVTIDDLHIGASKNPASSEGCPQAEGEMSSHDESSLPVGLRLHDFPRVSQPPSHASSQTRDTAVALATALPPEWQMTLGQMERLLEPQFVQLEPNSALLLAAEEHVFYTVFDRGCTIDMNSNNDKKIFVCDLPTPSPVSMGSGAMQGVQIGAAESFLARPQGGAFARISLEMTVPKLNKKLKLWSELQAQLEGHGGAISLPYGSDPSLPNILFPDQPGLDDLTLGDLRSPEDIPDFRYVPLVLRGRLQYVKEYERAHVIDARVDVYDWFTGEPYDRNKALARFFVNAKGINKPVVSYLHAVGQPLDQPLPVPSSTMLVTFRKISAPDAKAKNTDLLTLISGQQTQESKISNGKCLNLHLDRTTTNAQRSGDGGSSVKVNRKSSKPSPTTTHLPLHTQRPSGSGTERAYMARFPFSEQPPFYWVLTSSSPSLWGWGLPGGPIAHNSTVHG